MASTASTPSAEQAVGVLKEADNSWNTPPAKTAGNARMGSVATLKATDFVAESDANTVCGSGTGSCHMIFTKVLAHCRLHHRPAHAQRRLRFR